jgi:hypothetical protein
MQYFVANNTAQESSFVYMQLATFAGTTVLLFFLLKHIYKRRYQNSHFWKVQDEMSI